MPHIIIKPMDKKTRTGWAEAFRAAIKEDHEGISKQDLLLQNIKNKFDEEDWEW